MFGLFSHLHQRVQRHDQRGIGVRAELNRHRPLRMEALESRRLLAMTVIHAPYLQLGNAELGSQTDQIEILWQTTGNASNAPYGDESFEVNYRLASDPDEPEYWNSVTVDPGDDLPVFTGVTENDTASTGDTFPSYHFFQ